MQWKPYHTSLNNHSLINILICLKKNFLLLTLLSLTGCVAVETVPAETPALKTQDKKPTNKPEVKPGKFQWKDHELQKKTENKKAKQKTDIHNLKKRFNIKNRMSLSTTSKEITEKKYRFEVEDVDIHVALREFANKYQLNIFIEQEIEGNISVDFKDISLKKAMTLMLGSHDYFWTWNNDLIHVSRLQTKIFVVDYLRLTRSGQATTNSSVSNATSPHSADDNARNSTSIEQNDHLAFWDELESQLASLVSDNGRLAVNRLSGTVQITDNPARIKEVGAFITSLKSALHRQVEIDARIIEVTLSDNNALGIDWNAINIMGITGSLTSAITNNNNGLALKSNTLSLGYQHDKFSTLITALEEQGSIKVVSQPRIRVLNNQPSLIKVGTDRTFFTQTESRLITAAGSANVTISDEPVTVTEGLVLSVTPQISHDRWIMLDISPVITRIVETTTSRLGSTAPVLDIKQASTLIRARDGEMIILGGLIQDEEVKSVRKVPFFSKLPFIGKFFESHYSSTIKKELIIFLAPRLIL